MTLEIEPVLKLTLVTEHECHRQESVLATRLPLNIRICNLESVDEEHGQDNDVRGDLRRTENVLCPFDELRLGHIVDFRYPGVMWIIAGSSLMKGRQGLEPEEADSLNIDQCHSTERLESFAYLSTEVRDQGIAL